MAADGTIVIETDIRTEKLRNKLDKLNNDIERQAHKVAELGDKYNELMEGSGEDELQRELVELENRYERQSVIIDRLQRKRDALFAAGREDEAWEMQPQIQQAEIALDKIDKQIQELENRIANGAATEEIESARLELERAQIALERMENDAADVEEQLEEASQNGSAFAAAVAGAQASLQNFGHRIKTIAKKVFVFTLISTALRGIKEYMGDVLNGNKDFQASLARLKGTLMTAFQPLMEVIIPLLQAFVNILNVAAGYIAKFTSFLAGSSTQASAAAAKAAYEQADATEALGNAAQKAKKQMSGLDEMRTWQSDSGGGASANATMPSVDFSGIESSLSELEGIISGVLLVVGVVLAFSGVSIPLGIAMMALGAAGLASAAVNWNELPYKTREAITAVLTIGGALSFIVGLILVLTGAMLPLGIGLMIVGAAMLGTAVAVNWDYIADAMQGPIGKILAIVSGALYVLGLILVLTGVGLPIGLGLILAGAAGLASVVAFNWNSIVDSIKNVWAQIKQFWRSTIAPVFTLKWWLELGKKCVNGYIGAWETGLNALISLIEKVINWVISGLNELSFDVPDWVPGIGGEKFGFDLDKVSFGRLSFPRLAQGAVIPANKEFLAVLGDQKNGRNLETPESLMRQVVREESGGSGTYAFIAELNGRTLFKEVIEQGKLARRMTGKNPFLLGG